MLKPRTRFAMTMTACSRPNYLAETLDSLAANQHLDQFTLHFGVEPVSQEVLDICRAVDFMDTHIHVNSERLGVRENPYQLLTRTFAAGYEGVLYLEDDVVLSPDAVDLVLHYAKSPEAEQHRCLCLYNKDSHAENNPAVIETGRSIVKFSALGFYAPLPQWEAFFRPTWHASDKGWDFSIGGADVTAHTVARPAISRSHHIGRFGGAHYVASNHDKHYITNPIWGNSAPPEYVCVPWGEAGSR
jgi:GT2 family glycosyltransferase